MKRSLCLSLVLLVISAMFLIETGADAAVLEPLEITLGQPYHDCKYIEAVLGPDLILQFPKHREGLVVTTSRLTKIHPDRVKEILGAMFHVQCNYPPTLRKQHALFACDETQTLGLFLSIVRQVDNILNVHSKDNPIVHTALRSNAGLQSLYLTGMLAFLGYKCIYINIISPGALERFGKECHIQDWMGQLTGVKKEFQKLAYNYTTINVHVYGCKEGYIDSINRGVATVSDSFYIGDDDVAPACIEEIIEHLSQPKVSVFDVIGSQVIDTKPDVVMHNSGMTY